MRRTLRMHLAWALGLLACAAWSSPCVADLVILAPDLTVNPGDSGAFDLLIENTNPTGGASFDIAAFTAQLTWVGTPGVQFTDVTIDTNPITAPYIFVTSGTTMGGGPFSFDTFPNTSFTASDSEFAVPGFRTINPGEVFGLAHVSYAVDTTATPGTRDLLIDVGTSLADAAGDPVPFMAQNGSLTVGVVPEPASMALLAVGMVGLCLVAQRHRPARTA